MDKTILYSQLESKTIFDKYYDSIDMTSLPDIIRKLIGIGRPCSQDLIDTIQLKHDSYIQSLLQVRQDIDAIDIMNEQGFYSVKQNIHEHHMFTITLIDDMKRIIR